MNASARLNRRLQSVLILFCGLLVFGTLGYRWIEQWSWHDALFMTVTTISTVGYGEVRPLSPIGEVFTMLLILSGVGVVAYAFTNIADYVVAGELNGLLRRQRMVRTMHKLHQHYVICGFGRVGQEVVAGLRANHYAVVVIDANADYANELEQKGIPYIIGDAAEDYILEQAGIERARGLCSCLPDDAKNVFVVLSARTLSPDLTIISRCNGQENERKLRIAGANQVINPYLITGHRMTAQVIHPSVIEFLDVVMRRGELELRIEEIKIGPASQLRGQSLADARIRSETGVNVLAIRRANGELLTDLGEELVLEPNDALICLGTEPQLANLAQHTHDERHALRLT